MNLKKWLIFTKKSDEEKIRDTFQEFHQIMHAATGPATLSEYAQAHDITMHQAEDWKFALTADDIIKQRLRANLIGCSGRAAVFSKLLQQRMIPHKVILTAVVKDLNRAHNDIEQGNKPNLINGHQIIAVEIDGRLRMFDPGDKSLQLIKGDVYVNRAFKYNFSNDDYVITNIMSPNEYERIDTPGKLQSAYMQIWNHSQINQNDDR